MAEPAEDTLIGLLMDWAARKDDFDYSRLPEILLRIIDARIPEAFLNDDLRNISTDSQYFNDGWQQNRIVIAESGGATLSLSTLSRASRFAYTLDAHTWIGIPLSVRSDELIIEEYQIDGASSGAPSTDHVRLVETHHLRHRELRKLTAGKAYRLMPPTPMAVLSFSTPATENILIKIDCEGGRSVESEHIQNDLMALCSAAEILGAFGDERSFEILESHLSHTSHHVRWAVATALVQISPSRALGSIHGLEHDANPLVREAALRTTKRLSAQLFQSGDV